MNYLRQIQRGIDYIEANLEFDIELNRVSEVAGISHWHFQRIFKALTGETLKTYVRSRRLGNSLERLLCSDDRIVEIAVGAGYESQEAFTRAFKKAFQLTPNEYRKLGDKSLFLRKVQFDRDYLHHINSNVSLEPELYAQAPMTLVGLKTSFFSVDSDKNNIGQLLPPLWARFLEGIETITDAIGGTCYGLVRQASAGSDRLEYHAAIEVRSTEANVSPPPGMVTVALRGARYARFTHRGDAKAIDRTVNYIYSTWLAQSGLRHTYGPDLEIYDHEYDAESADSVMYYAIPVA